MRYQFLILVLIILSAIPGQSAQAGWQPFALTNGFIVIDVEINGQAARAILDSGASFNMIRSDFVEKHGQAFKLSNKINAQGIYGKKRLQVYSGIPIQLFGLDLVLNDVAEGLEFGPELLFGGGFFKDVIVQIDYPGSRIRLLGKKAVDMKQHANVPMKRARGSRFPAIQVEANNANVWLILDTGNSAGILIKRGFAIENGWLNDKSDVSEQVSVGVFESSKTEKFHLDAFKVGPYELDNVMVSVPMQGQVANIGKHDNRSAIGTHLKSGVQTKGIIGYDILKHFIVTIDYMAYKVNLYAP